MSDNYVEKCVCGYAIEKEFHYDERPIKGDQDFIKLKMSNDVLIVDADPPSFAEPDKYKLIACPKCGTVKVEL